MPLKSVADLSFGQGPSAVRRYNQSRRLYIDADLAPGVQLGTATKKVYALPTLKNLPQGVRLVETGDTEFMNELVANFAIAVAAGVLMVLAVLVLLFARVFQPITILSALPLSLGGAVLALVPHQYAVFPARDDRCADAHGHRRQEFHLAGGFRHRRDARRQDPPAGDCRSGPQARAAHRHDHRGHGGGHAARGHRAWAKPAISGGPWRSPSSAD